jgi:hypothetical protein
MKHAAAQIFGTILISLLQTLQGIDCQSAELCEQEKTAY